MKYILCFAVLLGACSNTDLGQDTPILTLLPESTTGQTATTDPPGVNIGQRPLYTITRASFRVRNDGLTRITLNEVTLDNIHNMRGTTQTESPLPVTLDPSESLLVAVDIEPLTEAVLHGEMHIAYEGPHTRGIITGIVDGSGVFIGGPGLEIRYAGAIHRVPEDCTIANNTCVLPSLAFGNVPIASQASQSIDIRNRPDPGTCTPNPDALCNAVCVLTLDDLHVNDDRHLFGIAGQAQTPFQLAPVNPSCSQSGETRLVLDFAGMDHEATDLKATFVLGSNMPGAPVVHIPLNANVRVAPIAVARIKLCGAEEILNCTPNTDFAPLQTVYLDGSRSYDPSRPGDLTALVAYHWDVLEMPDGANPADVVVTGDNQIRAALWLPLAGRYRLRLTVTNVDGLSSAPSDTSDIELIAIPDSRFHVQLIWDNAQSDIDLHMVHVESGAKPYHATNDCFWKTCSPAKCDNDPTCTPIRWFPESNAFSGSNPRLDIDDTHGFGPENINIDAPQAGTYRLYGFYYGLVDPTNHPSGVTVRIYLDAVLRAEYRRIIHRNQLWSVAEIHWNEDNSSTVTPALSDVIGQTGAITAVPFSPYPDGIAAPVQF